MVAAWVFTEEGHPLYTHAQVPMVAARVFIVYWQLSVDVPPCHDPPRRRRRDDKVQYSPRTDSTL